MKMQKLMFSALLLCAPIGVAQAQTNAGTFLLSGQVNYYTARREFSSEISSANSGLVREDRTDNNFNIRPQVGFFIADNLAAGLGFGLGKSKAESTQTQYDSSNGLLIYNSYRNTGKSVDIGPFVRYYKMISEKAGFYGQLAGGYQYQAYKSTDNYARTISNESRGGYASFTPGFVFFLTPKIGVDFTAGSVSYYNTKTTTRNPLPSQEKGESTSSSFDANFGVKSVTVGASFYL